MARRDRLSLAASGVLSILGISNNHPDNMNYSREEGCVVKYADGLLESNDENS